MEDMENLVNESVRSETLDSNFSDSVASPAPSTSSSFRAMSTAGQRKRRTTNVTSADTDMSAKEIARGQKNEAVLEALKTLTNLKSQAASKDQFSAFGELAAIQMRALPFRQGKEVLHKMNQYLLQCLHEADEEVNKEDQMRRDDSNIFSVPFHLATHGRHAANATTCRSHTVNASAIAATFADCTRAATA